MANKRMFTLDIVDSDAFLELPLTAQALYFQLNMHADDDGFVGNPKKVIRSIADDEKKIKQYIKDLKILIEMKFLIEFDNNVVVIKHWRMHNTLSASRYHETTYITEKDKLFVKRNGAYSLSDGEKIDDSEQIERSKRQTKDKQKTNERQTIDEQKTNSGLDKGLDIGLGLDKDIDKGLGLEEVKEKGKEKYSDILRMFNDTCVSLPRAQTLSEDRKKAIKARLNKYTIDDFQTLFEMAESSDFLKGQNKRNWIANFDWLIKDANMAKVLDGNYENRSGNGSIIDEWAAAAEAVEARRRGG